MRKNGMPQPGELWRRVPGNLGAYEVSSLGRVRGRQLFLLSPDIVRGGYAQVTLYGPLGPKRFKVHTLVLMTFVGPCPEGSEALHGNGEPADNRVENLRWGTRHENAADKVRHGTVYRPKGEKHHAHKLTAGQVTEIRRAVAGGKSQRSLARAYGVSPALVCLIVNRKNWSHVA